MLIPVRLRKAALAVLDRNNRPDPVDPSAVVLFDEALTTVRSARGFGAPRIARPAESPGFPIAVAFAGSARYPTPQPIDEVTEMDARALEILDFWFGPRSSSTFNTFRDDWFSSVPNPEFDARCAAECRSDHERAKAGELDHWAEEPLGCLALLILCDQIPRNIFRGDARSFATDGRALDLARAVVDRGWDKEMFDVERLFAYLPFEHSENLGDQRRCVALYASLPDSQAKKQEWIDYAVQHMEIIERFGRFPHRNAILGRASSPEEVAFLEETGLHFGTRIVGRDTKPIASPSGRGSTSGA